MGFLSLIVKWLNGPMNALGVCLQALIGTLPGWLSNTIISATTGAVLMLIFKYTSNQKAIGQVRDSIKANMLAMKLYKDSMSVTLQSQGRLFGCAFLLLFHAIVPMLVMMVPVTLLLAQLGLCYQARPLQIAEQATVTMRLRGDLDSTWPSVILEPISAAQVTIGPVRIFSLREISWDIKAREKGYHQLVFRVDKQQIEKELAIGGGFMRTSVMRPGWNWSDILMFPREQPFSPDSIVESISIDYPDRSSMTSGTDWWIVYFFVASIVFGFVFKPFLKVKI